MVWEWNILGPSPFRKLLADNNLESFLPQLDFQLDRFGLGTVERLKLDGSTPHSNEDFYTIGNFIALSAWLGSTDLHKDNIIFGRSGNSVFKIASVDVENLFYDFESPGATGLLPTSKIPVEICGLSLLLNDRDKMSVQSMAAVCAGFVVQLDKLDRVEATAIQLITDSFSGIEMPIRTIIRKTLSYYRFFKGLQPLPVEIPFIDSELEQLRRGDVPYYFRFPERTQTFFYDSPNSFKEVSLELENAKFVLDQPRLVVESSIDGRKFGIELRKNGLVQIARAFFNKTEGRGKASYGGCVVDADGPNIIIDYDGLRLACKKPANRSSLV